MEKLEVIEKLETNDAGDEMPIFHIKDLKGNLLNLTQVVLDEGTPLVNNVIEVEDIINEDLIVVVAEIYTGHDMRGIYSFKQKKLITPFIIDECNVDLENQVIGVDFNFELWDEGAGSDFDWDFEINMKNNYAYYSLNGYGIQNQGVIKEKINEYYYILRDKYLGSFMNVADYSFMLYSVNFDEEEDYIRYRNILEYEISEDKKSLTMRFKTEGDKKEVTIKL